MQFSKLVLALATAAVAPVSGVAITNPAGTGVTMAARDEHEPHEALAKRSCYFAGAPWGSEKDLALDKVELACKSMQGTFNRGETKARCYQLTLTKKVNFSIVFKDIPSEGISFDTCKTNLRLEIKGCTAGGESTHGNFKYRSDPNLGRC